MARLPDRGTVRGAITRELLKYRDLMKPLILETGACRPDAAWWRDLRSQLEFEEHEWVGTDIEDGVGVDIVADLCAGWCELEPVEYNTVICAETLEHVREPLAALRSLHYTLENGGRIFVTMPFAFPIHNFPSDYWRFTPDGLYRMLDEVGFTDIETYGFNEFQMDLYDHDINQPARRVMVPMHVFGMGVA